MAVKDNIHSMIACPVCKKQTLYHPTNFFRPFCSERCKIIDLGSWATEEFKIPGEPIDFESDKNL